MDTSPDSFTASLRALIVDAVREAVGETSERALTVADVELALAPGG